MVPYTSISCRQTTFDEERRASEAQLRELNRRIVDLNGRIVDRMLERQDQQRATSGR